MTFTQKYLKPGLELYDNQKENIPLLLSRRKALLTDKAGSGKTLTVLYAYAYLKEKGKLDSCLVMSPKSAYDKNVWPKDAKKFTNFKCIDLEEIIKKANKSAERMKKLISQYDIIYGKHSHATKFARYIRFICNQPNLLLVVDEIHDLRRVSKRSTAFKASTSNPSAYWGMSATPISRDMEDAFNIINMVSPGYLGSFFAFRDIYCETEEQVIGRSPNGGLRKVTKITGVRDKELFQRVIKPLVIVGKSFVNLNFHYIDYTMSDTEKRLYRRVAKGVGMSLEISNEEWIKRVLEEPEDIEPRYIKEVKKHSSRFIYLQTAADGVLTPNGTQDNWKSLKIDLLLAKLKDIIDKGQSTTVYFDYYASLDAVKYAINQQKWNCTVLESSGRHTLTDKEVTPSKVKMKSHIILSTKASAASVSYYFMNNVIFFHVPTVPDVFIQAAGRITRKNTLFPDDLHCWIFRSDNIDLYKLMLISFKAHQMKIIAGEDKNLPDTYMGKVNEPGFIEQMKKILLWN